MTANQIETILLNAMRRPPRPRRNVQFADGSVGYVEGSSVEQVNQPIPGEAMACNETPMPSPEAAWGRPVPAANDGGPMPSVEAAWNEAYGEKSPAANAGGPLPDPAAAWNFEPDELTRNVPSGTGPLPEPEWAF